MRFTLGDTRQREQQIPAFGENDDVGKLRPE